MTPQLLPRLFRPRLSPAIAASLLLHAINPMPAAADWKPVEGVMMTEWGRKVTGDSVWQEYPRPQLERGDWTNLNGLWDYAVTPGDTAKPETWNGSILVPFCPESALSGVGRLIDPKEALWYRRSLPAPKPAKRALLHFEAVDYKTTVWVNGRMIGSHTGGHTPFTFDITSALKPADNELLVRVDDQTEGFQLHGKQKLSPGGIWYTRVTGIWQTVWLENVPERFIHDLDFTTDIRTGRVRVEPKLSGKAPAGEKIRVTASIAGKRVAEGSGSPNAMLEIPEARLWSPDSPNLYDLEVELLDSAGTVIDAVKSYVALREFGRTRDANGNWRFTLNGESIFHWGPLDQGWWPDGLLTPPSEAAMVSDIDYLKAAGFNMIRKHIKIEPRRYYHHCDRIGMLMWQDQVSMGFGPDTQPKGSNPRWTRMAPNPPEGKWPDDAHEQFVTEYKRMVDHLRDVPCIAVWVPFNEAWGQHRTMEVGKMAIEYDRTRPINIASGGNFWPIGDIADEHRYPDPGFPLEDRRFDDYIKVVGEFGGHGMPIDGHLWNKSSPNWGYGGLPKDLNEWKERYTRSIRILADLRKRGIAAGVYTQTTDVEVEINGFLTYDRVSKVDPAWLKPLSDMLLNTPDVVKTTVLLPTSEKEPQEWLHTTTTPPEGWEKPDFDDSSWARDKGGFGQHEMESVRPGTRWDTPEIWIRRGFDLPEIPSGEIVLRMFHDEDARVFINGQPVAGAKGYVTGYSHFPVNGGNVLKPGHNVIAIHCRQTQGGQFIDAGISVETPR